MKNCTQSYIMRAGAHNEERLQDCRYYFESHGKRHKGSA